jgi:hypothetical protein
MLDRRGFFSFAARGLARAALTGLLLRDGTVRPAAAAAAAAPAGVPGEAGDPPPHLPAKARRVIHLCMCGGVSQIDSFDHKPGLDKLHGKPLPSKEKPETFFGKIGRLRRSDWDFRPRGKCGLMMSDLFPHLGEVADELTVIRSMVADSANHTPATFQELTGFRLNGFPVMGAWLSYGLGAETDELPAFVVLPDARGLPASGPVNWSNGFLPARHQGVALRTKGEPIDDLFPSKRLPEAGERESRDLLADLNRLHLETRDGSDVLSARIRSYELAAKMQLAVPQVADLSKEPASVRELYGLDGKETADFGRSCLLARRLLEKGVRYVQVFSGGSFGSPRINWDGHENVKENHSQEALRVDRPIAGLLKDLRSRGMLDDTLVLFTTEFGRTPFTESAADVVGTGRDHNMYGFSVWMAGAGLKHGTAYGETDDFGWKSVVNPVHWHDFHATVLHLLGIDHERLTFYHNGIRRRLTNVHGEVVSGILA